MMVIRLSAITMIMRVMIVIMVVVVIMAAASLFAVRMIVAMSMIVTVVMGMIMPADRCSTGRHKVEQSQYGQAQSGRECPGAELRSHVALNATG